jgi:HEAT repeat protein
MQDGNGNVRELAIMCLNEIGGPRAAAVFVEALSDTYLAVRSRAVAYLMTHNSPDLLQPLLVRYDSATDPILKARIPLVIGKLGNPDAVPELKQRSSQSPPPDAARSIGLALARLREQPWLDQVVQQLQSPDARVRHQGLRDLEYLGQPDLLRHVVPLLQDRTPVVNVGPPPSVVWLRVCDAAVIAIARVTGRRFSFNALVERPFTDAEIAEVAGALTAGS